MAQSNQSPGALRGVTPLAYAGTTPNMVFNTRRPTPRDVFNFVLGTWWIIPTSTNGNPLSEEIWILVGNAQNIGRWKRIHSGGSPTELASVITTVYDTPGTFTHTFDVTMVDVQVECQGGGAGGSGTQVSGGAGGYCKKLFPATQVGVSQSLTVGAGGAGGIGSSSSGSNGGDTTFGSFLTAFGSTAWVYPSMTLYSAGGSATGGDINIPGAPAGSAFANEGDPSQSSKFIGGSSFLGFGGYFDGSTVPLIGADGTGYGSGGSGSNGVQGGSGSNGIVIITEFLG